MSAPYPSYGRGPNADYYDRLTAYETAPAQCTKRGNAVRAQYPKPYAWVY